MKNKLGLAAILFCAAIAGAQDAAYQGQSWVGLLVPASCTKAARHHTNKANRESDLTVTSRTTTPAVDASGTRGSSTALEAGANTPADKAVLPATGDVLSQKESQDPNWAAARRQALSLGPSCVVHPDTTAFALMLPDGKVLPFDQTANEGISRQLPSLPAAATSHRVLRVFVEGKLQNGAIALDSVRM